MELEELMQKLHIDTKSQDLARKRKQDRLKEIKEATGSQDYVSYEGDKLCREEFGAKIVESEEPLIIKRYDTLLGDSEKVNLEDGKDILRQYFG